MGDLDETARLPMATVLNTSGPHIRVGLSGAGPHI